MNPTGYAPSNNDCDDGDAAISPSANELCTNNIDENCDGHNTAGATDVSTFLVDADGVTFGSGERDSNGDLAYALDLCVQPYGYVPYSVNDPLDCNDGDFELCLFFPNDSSPADHQYKFLDFLTDFKLLYNL